MVSSGDDVPSDFNFASFFVSPNFEFFNTIGAIPLKKSDLK